MEKLSFTIKYKKGDSKGHGENVNEIIKYIIEREFEELKTEDFITEYELNISNFTKGDKVKHEVFGIGTVFEVSKYLNFVDVMFDDYDTAKIVPEGELELV